MSELKEHQFCESDEFFREYPGPLSNETHLYYLKSEADKVIARHKYKRCLAMTKEWRSYAAFCGIQSSWHNNRGFGKTAEKWTWKECHAWKCVKRWQGLAEEFEEVEK